MQTSTTTFFFINLFLLGDTIQALSFANITHKTASNYKDFTFNTNNYAFLFYFSEKDTSFLPLIEYRDELCSKLMPPTLNHKIYDEFFSEYSGNVWLQNNLKDFWGEELLKKIEATQHRTNSFTLIPTISGFQFHRQKKNGNTANIGQSSTNTNNHPTGIQIPLYLNADE